MRLCQVTRKTIGKQVWAKTRAELVFLAKARSKPWFNKAGWRHIPKWAGSCEKESKPHLACVYEQSFCSTLLSHVAVSFLASCWAQTPARPSWHLDRDFTLLSTQRAKQAAQLIFWSNVTFSAGSMFSFCMQMYLKKPIQTLVWLSLWAGPPGRQTLYEHVAGVCKVSICAETLYCKASCLLVEQKINKRQHPSLCPWCILAQHQGWATQTPVRLSAKRWGQAGVEDRVKGRTGVKWGYAEGSCPRLCLQHKCAQSYLRASACDEGKWKSKRRYEGSAWTAFKILQTWGRR